MTPREQAAFKAGIEVAQQMALTAAVTLEVRDDARELRQQAAAAALQGFAAGLKIAFLEPPADQTRMRRVFEAISAQDGDSGTVECPECKGRLSWARDSFNGHLHGQCETDGCLRWMQ
ncbi:hypothetical protein FV242_33025 [Methylobacterium sp. WL64]|uniref:hypothetical protein n=1 Tax=Methylobacterium sp. WL64 TaxID=2603894 RepID=UPI0011CA3DF0|nr:hypothetical protein [Methylobacterium sp. WL64]TXM96796.1 hypothetical protein FV242_33025 [Methylobacterium sp. WL64]